MLIYTFSQIQFFTLQFSEFVESFIILHNQQSIRAPTTELLKKSLVQKEHIFPPKKEN